jgi:hypothetical protein
MATRAPAVRKHQSSIGQAGTEGRILLRMGIRKLTQRLGRLGMLLFPAFATTESRLSSQTDDAASSLGQAKRHGLAPQPKTTWIRPTPLVWGSQDEA